MTDVETIKALECCLNGNVQKSQAEVCDPCPLFHEGNCTDILKQNALDLINRLNAEIERLSTDVKLLKADVNADTAEINGLKRRLITAKAEARKEFAERLKEKAIARSALFNGETIYLCDVDSVLSELEGGSK